MFSILHGFLPQQGFRSPHGLFLSHAVRLATSFGSAIAASLPVGSLFLFQRIFLRFQYVVQSGRSSARPSVRPPVFIASTPASRTSEQYVSRWQWLDSPDRVISCRNGRAVRRKRDCTCRPLALYRRRALTIRCTAHCQRTACILRHCYSKTVWAGWPCLEYITLL